MPRKTENKAVLARIERSPVASSAPAKAIREDVQFKKIEGAAFGTMCQDVLKTAAQYCIRHAPGDKRDIENPVFAEVAFYDEMRKLIEKRLERAKEVLVEEGYIVDPETKTEPGKYDLGASSGFTVNVTVSNPRTVQDDNYIIQTLLKSRKVPEMITKQILAESKKPIGAKTRTLRIGVIGQPVALVAEPRRKAIAKPAKR